MIHIALNIIAESFEGRVDKGGGVYTGHLHRVWNTIMENGGDEALQCIALLHDLLEDCPDWTVGRLSTMFSKRIVRGVEGLTHMPGEAYSDYVDRIALNEDAVQVKLADLKDNMDITRLEKLTDNDIERLKKYHKAFCKLKSIT